MDFFLLHLIYIDDYCDISYCRIEKIKGDDDELPGDFDNEIHKWALEC